MTDACLPGRNNTLMIVTLVSTAADAALAARIREDVRRMKGVQLAESVQPGRDNVLVAVLSPAALADASVEAAIYDALDAGQHIIPVLAGAVELPKHINHFAPLNFSENDDFAPLRGRLEAIQSGTVGRPPKVLTPRARQANRRTGVWMVALVLVMFVVSVWAIITFDIESPADEYERVDTEAALTRDYLIEPTMAFYGTLLPRSTPDAENFAPTVEALPTRMQPFVARTATAIHATLSAFGSGAAEATPTPEG
jgi:hypothetical protein